MPTMTSEVIRTGSKYVPWGDDGTYGLFPQRMVEAYQKSKTLRSVLTQKASLVAANPMTEGARLLRKIESSVSQRKDQDLRALMYRVALDYNLHGEGFLLEVRYIDGSVETSYAEHLDASFVRFANDFDGWLRPRGVWASPNWAHYTRREYRPVHYPLSHTGEWKVEELEDGRVKKSRVIRVEDYEPGKQVYGRGNWTGAYYDAILEPELPRWNYTHLMNSIHLSGILYVKSLQAASDENRDELVDTLRRQLKGEHVHGPSTPIVTGDEDDELKFLQYTLPTDGAFKDLNATCERNIIMAAGMHPALMGVAEPGKLGNTREIEQHHRRVMAFEIEPLQQKIIRAYGKTLVSPFAEEFKTYGIGFENRSPVSAADYVSQDFIDRVIPEDEVKKDLGYAAN